MRALIVAVALVACGREETPHVAKESPVLIAPIPPVAPSGTWSREPTRADAGSLAPVVGSAVETECAPQSLPPGDLVRDNIAATNVTGLAEIVASSKVGLDGKSPAPSSGYVTFRFEVRVLRWFSGNGPERMILTQGAEAGSTPAAPGRLLFFSACAVGDAGVDRAVEPDVGYFFPLDAACRSQAEAAGENAARRAKVGPKHRARACERR